MKITEIKEASPFKDLFEIKLEELEAIQNHMYQFGYDPSQPIVLWKEKGIIVDGHTRFQAAKGLYELSMVPGIGNSVLTWKKMWSRGGKENTVFPLPDPGLFNQRGQSENFNKELKIGFGMERMPCGQTPANAVFFRIGVIAYNLFIGFKRLPCPESWLKQTIATFRWKMVQVAGRIVRHAGETVLKLMIDLEKLEFFKGIRNKSFELSLCPDG